MTRDFFINALIESAKRYKKDEVYLSGLKKNIEYYVSEYEKAVLPQADVIKSVCDHSETYEDLDDMIRCEKCNKILDHA